MIEFAAVNFGYSPGNEIFSDFSWRVETGQTWTVVGPSGVGKSTLLSLAAGLEQPTSGDVRVAGATLDRPRPETGLVLQDYGLLPWLTVRGNIALGLRIRRFYGPDGVHSPKDARLDRSAEHDGTEYWITRLGLRDVASSFPGELSGGQRQRTALGRTFLLRPDLLLLDEPFGSLDHAARTDLQTLLQDLHNERPHTRVFVTHSLEEAATLGDAVLVLSATGPRILTAGPDLLDELRREAKSWGEQP